MTSLVAKKLAGNALAGHLNARTEDPYFEQVPILDNKGQPILDRHGQPKTKKRRKGLPVGISENDEKVLTRVKKTAYRLDLSLSTCCGIRFGWSSVIGLVPFAGDAAECFMAWLLVRKCQKIDGGLPASLHMRMWINILIDFGIGFVPFLGDIADAMYHCNTKNAAILEKYLREQGAKNIKAQGQQPPDISGPVTFDLEEMERNNDPPPPSYDATTENTGPQQPTGLPQQPKPALGKRSTGSWFGGRSKQTDPEHGHGDEITQIPLQNPPTHGSRV